MKTNSSRTILGALVCALVSPLALAGGPRVDLTTRRAIYVTKSPSEIDLKNDKYVAAGGTITVGRSQGEGCQANKCTFHLGIIAIKSGDSGALSTYGQYTVQALGTTGNTIVFANSESTKQQVLPVKLAPGKNVVTFAIDPAKKIVETDESNNSITVTIVVE
jgi:hypothetical protein